MSKKNKKKFKRGIFSAFKYEIGILFLCLSLLIWLGNNFATNSSYKSTSSKEEVNLTPTIQEKLNDEEKIILPDLSDVDEEDITALKDDANRYYLYKINGRTYLLPHFTGYLIEKIKDAPLFEEIKTLNRPFSSYENYSKLDELGRVGEADTILGLDTLPTEKRKTIAHIKPTGWQQAKYPFIKGQTLFNRSHLIAFQLSAENDNIRNLLTGTRDFNQIGMTRYEEHVNSYIRATGNHVRYRVTPVFLKDELLARGVIMEGLSLEDEGSGVNFAIFIHNVQRGVSLNYQDGSSTTKGIYEEYIGLGEHKPKKFKIRNK